MNSLRSQGLEPMLAEIPRDLAREEDEAWYWAAPILLDKKHGDLDVTRAWFNQPDLDTLWGGIDSDSGSTEEDDPKTAWADHVDIAHECFAGSRVLGKPPADLAMVLAQMALASPGVVSLRGLTRIADQPEGSAGDRIEYAMAGATPTDAIAVQRTDVISLIQD